MRIAIIGDLHANLPALRAVLDDAQQVGVEGVFCVGDVVGRGPHPEAVIAELRVREIPTVQGNWDEAVGMDREHAGAIWSSPEAEAIGQTSLVWTAGHLSDEAKAWLRQLPATLRVDLAGHSMLLFHGSPIRQTEYLWEDRPSRIFSRLAADEGDAILAFGHTHEAWHRVVGSSHLVAVGSVGCGSDGDARARYAVVYVGQPDIVVGFRAVEYDHAAVVDDMAAHGLPIELLREAPAPHVAAGDEDEAAAAG